MAAIRYRLIYDYIGVNYSTVGDIFKNKISQLFIQIEELLSRDESKIDIISLDLHLSFYQNPH